MIIYYKHCIFFSLRLMPCIVFICLTACGSHYSPVYSKSAITNGILAASTDYRSVVKIFRHESGLLPILCTGTFVADRKILTAAHCLGSQQDVTFEISWIDALGIPLTQWSSKFAAHPSYIAGVAIQPHDIAIIELSGDSGTPADIGVPLTPPSDFKDKKVTMVGFGNTRNTLNGQIPTGTGSGEKRVGSNRVYAATKNGLIIVTGSSGCEPFTSDSTTGDGDSGGPLFIDDTLVGVTLGGGMLPTIAGESCPKAISYFANIGNEINLYFIRKYLD